MKSSGRERRIHPRIDLQLPIKVAAHDYDFATDTQNLSCLGTYCRITKYIPPFTRVKIKLNLPTKRLKTPVECEGVVVRTDDESSGGFNVAIFFNRIKEQSRQKLSEYVSSNLTAATALS